MSKYRFYRTICLMRLKKGLKHSIAIEHLIASQRYNNFMLTFNSDYYSNLWHGR
jgi:hypothetical protein